MAVFTRCVRLWGCLFATTAILWTTRGTGTEPAKPAGLPESAVRLSHVDNTAEGKQSYGGTGFAVRFERPAEASHLAAVEIYCSRYGMPQPPADDFHIYLLDADQKIVKDLAYPYSRIERGQERWYTLPVAPAAVPEVFFVGLWFNAHQTKGIYVGKDADVEASHSYTGTPDGGYKPVTEKADWMVRAWLVPDSDAAQVAAAMPAAPPPQDIGTPEDQTLGREILVKLAKANRYWLVGPSDEVRSYQYNFQLGDNPPQPFEVARPSAASEAVRQAITYSSVVHYLAAHPERVSFRRVAADAEKVTLAYVLAEPAPINIGNGIDGSWHGFFSMRVSEGTLTLDAMTHAPLVHEAEGLREVFSKYAEPAPGEYAPLEIAIEHGAMQFAWTFRVYKPGLWLLDSARYTSRGGEPRQVARVTGVRVNGAEAAAETD